MFSEFCFPYGNDFLSARIPAKNIAVVLNTSYQQGLENIPTAMEQALNAPIDRPPLADCVKSNNLEAGAVLMPASPLDHLKNIGKGLSALGNTKPIGIEVWGDAHAFIDFIGEEGANNMIYRAVHDHPDNTPC
jgi:hypothetical protein